MTRNSWRCTGVALVLLALSGCASDGVDSVAGRATNRPECLVGGEPISTARDSGVPSSRQRECEPDRSLNWSTESRSQDSMKVDFGKKQP